MARIYTNPTAGAVERYQSAFEQFEREHPSSNWLRDTRRRAMENFARLGFPTVRDEEWKYTDITPAANLAATPIFQFDLNGSAQKIGQNLPFSSLEAHLLVFVNGHFAPALSRSQILPEGVEIMPLSQAFHNENEVVQEHFGRILEENETFNALNTAFAQDGAFIKIPANLTLEIPIHLLFLTTGEAATVTHPRNLILLGNHAQAMVLETYASSGDGTYFSNAVTEISTGAGAKIEHIKTQIESPKAFHVGTIQIAAARDVTASSHVLNFGGRIVRNNSNAVLADENAEVTLNGLVVGRDSQVVDNHTSMDHAAPHCASHENYAHVLDDSSTGVFNGKIFVRLDAQKTDAKQSNRTLLLSPDAQINAKPQLEILADDVRCTHGATIGQLDEIAEFYLRARGIPKRQAKAILVRAFAAAVFESISIESVRAELEARLSDRLKG